MDDDSKLKNNVAYYYVPIQAWNAGVLKIQLIKTEDMYLHQIGVYNNFMVSCNFGPDNIMLILSFGVIILTKFTMIHVLIISVLNVPKYN